MAFTVKEITDALGGEQELVSAGATAVIDRGTSVEVRTKTETSDCTIVHVYNSKAVDGGLAVSVFELIQVEPEPDDDEDTGHRMRGVAGVDQAVETTTNEVRDVLSRFGLTFATPSPRP